MARPQFPAFLYLEDGTSKLFHEACEVPPGEGWMPHHVYVNGPDAEDPSDYDGEGAPEGYVPAAWPQMLYPAQGEPKVFAKGADVPKEGGWLPHAKHLARDAAKAKA